MHELSGDTVYRDTKGEVLEFIDLVKGGEMKEPYEDFFRPVFVLDAMQKAYETQQVVEVLDPAAFLK